MIVLLLAQLVPLILAAPSPPSPVANWTQQYDGAYAEWALDFAAAAYAANPLPCLLKNEASLIKQVQVACDGFHDQCWAYIAKTETHVIFAVRGTKTTLQLITELV